MNQKTLSRNRMDSETARTVAEKLFYEAMNLDGDTAVEYINSYIANNYSLLIKDPVIRADGAWLYTKSGRKILDGVSAYSAANLGHNHPLVRELLKRILNNLTPTVLGRFIPDPWLGLLGKKITEMTGYESFLPANGGVEAPEAAIKLARRWGNTVKKVKGTPEIIWFDGCFHGRTLTVTQVFNDEPVSFIGFGPFVDGFRKIPYCDIDILKKTINENTIAIMIEPIQGEGGINIPPDGYLKEVHKLARENNVLVIYDEVQTGWGRTGKLFAWEYDGPDCRPDIICTGKSLSGGYLPVAGILADKKLMELFQPGSHGSTFGGSPLASAVALAALTAIEYENLPEQSSEKGKWVLEKLQKIASGSKHIKEVRGRGLMIGIELKQDGPDGHDFAEKLFEKGMIIKDTHKWVMRFTPPLVASDDDLNFALDCFTRVF